MFPNKVHFVLEERPNSFRKSGKEWALSAQFIGHEKWVIKCWEKKPSIATVEEIEEIAMRCFEVYHRHLQIPRFDVTKIDI